MEESSTKLKSSIQSKSSDEESMLKSAMREDSSEGYTTLTHEQVSPTPSDNFEKDYDFGSGSSRRDSDMMSWETISEEMRAEVAAVADQVAAEAGELDDDSPESSEDAAMINKCMYYSVRYMTRSANQFEELPENVTKVVTDDGAYIYVVGTAHFSKASQDDVEKVIRILQPDVVMVELCSSRVGVLKYDEESLLQAAKEVNLTKLRYAIREAGSVVSGVMQMLLLSMSAHITKQLGMAPGGEFRVACQEARQIPGCRVVLGDRPIQSTIGRAMAALSIFQKLQLAWHLIFSQDKITKEDVERYKQKDMIAEMLSEMTGDFPELSRVFVEERDQYMATMLTRYVENVRSDVPEYIHLLNPDIYYAATGGELDNEVEDDEDVELMHKSGYKPIVVAVVGIGHMSGIADNIGKNFDLRQLCDIPPPSMTSRTVKVLFKASLVAAFSWGVYSIVRWVGR